MLMPPSWINPWPSITQPLEGKGKGKVNVVTIADSKAELLGFVMNKDNKELQQKVNQALAEMKKDGTYNKIYKKMV
jgi:polar amino acid transport system substrate-binding protein